MGKVISWSDNSPVNRNNGNFFWIKLLVDIPETLYVDDYIHDCIQNFATLLIFSSEAASSVVSAKTFYIEFRKISSISYIKAGEGNNLRTLKQNIM